ncbi:MAG: PilC/PilY family type IV pilus protein [Pseudomonadota bacterium]|nr:PilC/PilY family type IV pilus protein [Pseudomonadota bacterium]
MSRPAPFRAQRKTLLALAAAAALAPHGTWALNLAQSPPGTVEPFVAPNVIISIDDSGSMGWRLQNNNSGNVNRVPNADGSWPVDSARVAVLRHALTQVFNDTTLLPNGQIRLAWQSMWNNARSPGVGQQKTQGNATSRAGANSVDSTASGVNSMRRLDDAHRANFLSFIASIAPSGGTPSHWMFSQADAYMRRPLTANSAWASNPGTAGAPFLGCRRNYHIMMTDGRWNTLSSGGSQDSNQVNKTLPDGTVYGSASAVMRPYNNLYHDTQSNTLADWAFLSWSDPLQTTGLTGTVQPTREYLNAPATENFGTDALGRPAVLDRYWNPRYNPATWPHMVTYTIGFSNDAITWPSAPTILAPTARVPFGYDGSFPDFITGNRTWPAMNTENVRALDLWHAALNGRGRFYAVNQAEDLERAFREIIGQINTQTEPETTSTAASGSNASRNEVGVFTGNYEPQKAWKGFVTAARIKPDGTTEPHPGWGGKTTADWLDEAGYSVNNRVVVSWSDTLLASGAETGGVGFRWSPGTTLSLSQSALLRENAAGVLEAVARGQGRLNYVRGDRSMEGDTPPAFRTRQSRQGSIVNSQVWYTGAPVSNYALSGYAAFTRAHKNRTPMIYVGGNDGMLHGFSAEDGKERLAYVPKGVIRTLNRLTDPAFDNTHRYSVDGSPMTGDVDMGLGIQDPSDPGYSTGYTPDWRTLLVGMLGAGGKGYFILDVTNPTSTDVGSLPAFSESNAQRLALIDRTRSALEPAPNCAALPGSQQAACNQAWTEYQDMGHITAKPVLDETNGMRTTQITRMNNNRWAVVMGNGYNSHNQRPVLLVQYLDGARELRRVQTTSATPGTGLAADNGLSAPSVVDLNGDGRADVVYAGDNLGNMWKFDLTSIDDSQWAVAFGGSPLFTATGPAALASPARTQPQPITVAPTVIANDRMKKDGAHTVPVGGMMVAFGTGRNVAQNDPNDNRVQSLYSVLDNTRYRAKNTSLGPRLEVHPGGGTCPGITCVPAPAALGTGVTEAKLAEQRIADVSSTHGRVDATQPLNTDTWANFNGWYLDFPEVGERLLKQFDFYDSSNLLTVFSQVPARGSNATPGVESCDAPTVNEERQFRTFLNVMDGKRPSVQVVDANNDGAFNSLDQNVSRAAVKPGSHTMLQQGNITLDIDNQNRMERLARMPEQSLRPSWRQVQ